MFCPEDGTEIPMLRSDTTNTYYPPCGGCGTVWRYNGEHGVYEQDPDYEDKGEDD